MKTTVLWKSQNIQLVLDIHWVCICKFAYLWKCIWNTKINSCLHGKPQTGGNLNSLNTHFPSWAVFLFLLPYHKELSTSWSTPCHVFFALFVCAFLFSGWFLFKMYPSKALKCFLVFLSAKRLWCDLQRKYMC